MTLQQLIKIKKYLDIELWRKEQEIDSLKQHIEEINVILRKKCKHKHVIDDYENVKDVICSKCGVILDEY